MATKSQLISLIKSNNLSLEEYSVLSKCHFQKEYNDFVTFIIHELNIAYKAQVLDIGCGPGWVSLELARRMPETKIVGLDFENKIIQIANRNKKLEKIDNVEFVFCSQPNLKLFTNQSFDTVISYGVLQFLNNQDKLLKEIKRLLKIKGRYAISTNRSNLTLMAKAAIWINTRTMPADFRTVWKESFRAGYTLIDLVNLLLKAELRDWKIRSSLFDFLIYNYVEQDVGSSRRG